MIGDRAPRCIVVIVADDLGFGDLGRWNFGASSTPAIDRLAAGGCCLSQHYSGSPVCAPARAALLTGRYPHRTGALDTIEAYGHDRLFRSERTLGDVLGAAGWRTGYVGKWHNGAFDPRYWPTARGFDEFFGFCGGWQDYYDYRLQADGAPVGPDGSYLTARLTDEAVAFVERHASERFLLLLAYNAPHFPFQAPEATVERYLARGFRLGVARIYAMVEELDRGVGRLVEALERHRLLEDALVLFTSDNGPQFGGEGEQSTRRFNCGFAGHKGLVFEGGVRTPAIVHWPGRLRGGTVSHDLAHFVDWLPTFADLAGAPLGDGPPLDGVSLAPTLLGSPRAEYPARFWQWNRFEPVWGCNAAMRDGDWKLVVPAARELLQISAEDRANDVAAKRRGLIGEIVTRTGDRPEAPAPPEPMLFDLSADPLETTDCRAREPARAERMLGELESWFRQVVAEYEAGRGRERAVP
ncbi:MAG TPA: sulfatase-like hydrolase/transferase [Acidimicrobiales bacterium]|nr:sulfatase-like hydrolase/transferase [Acidimicrobiales bacterium]